VGQEIDKKKKTLKEKIETRARWQRKLAKKVISGGKPHDQRQNKG